MLASLTTMTLALAALVTSAPITDGLDIANIEERDDIKCVKFCIGSGFGGDCWDSCVPKGQCIYLDYPYFEEASSVGPLPGVTCDFYKDIGCWDENALYGVTFPGYRSLDVLGFNDAIRSYRCY